VPGMCLYLEVHSLRVVFPAVWIGLCILPVCSSIARAQGAAAPETAPTLFPGGGLVSVGSLFTSRGRVAAASTSVPETARPTLANDTALNFTWGFSRDFDVTLLAPIVTNRIDLLNTTESGTRLGDVLALLKYRFFRKDSSRGTTQASVTFGPKFPSGSTSLRAASGTLLPAALQPGSGSTDAFLGANWTYTGLFNVRRLVADEDLHSLIRSQGTQATRLGSDLESRFWLSYRPYEASDGSREWFIGPAMTWLHTQDDRFGRTTQKGSGGDVFLAGISTYVGVRPGMHAWFAMDWSAGHSNGPLFTPVRRLISFGITQQFRMNVFRKEQP